MELLSALWPLAIATLFAICVFNLSEDDEIYRRVDALFAEWDRPGSPGCSLAITHEGEIAYARGYGLANLEYDIPNESKTVFHIASVSKQFTTFCIHLLALENKLSLDDEARRHLPELRDFGEKVTIRHLIHHTSGLRDQWDLLMLGGWRIEDVITQEDILQLIWRQRELNFAPGEREMYSNTGCTLLAEIVKRASGMAFSQFAEERIFRPLGMSSTHFHHDATKTVKNRAYSYEPGDDGVFRNALLNFSNEGATSLFTTVEDLAKWDRNFYEASVGEEAAIRAMRETFALNDGREIRYASGIVLGERRGLRTESHGGADAGYRSFFLRFPDQRLSVILLANLGSFDAGRMAYATADLLLEETYSEKAIAPVSSEPEKPKVAISDARLDAYAGAYRMSDGRTLLARKEEGKLSVFFSGARESLIPIKEREFEVSGEGGARYRFKGGEKGEILIRRVTDFRTLRGWKLEDQDESEKSLKAFVGEFYSEEIDFFRRIFLSDGRLKMRTQNRKRESQLKPLAKDLFEDGDYLYEFMRSERGKVIGVLLSTGRVQRLRFVKARVKTPRGGR